MTDLLTENARLRAALEEIAGSAAPDHWVPQHQHCVDVARAALATPAPDAPLPEHERDGFGRPVNPATPQEAVYIGQHSVAPAPDAVQDAAKVPTAQEIVDAWLDEIENFSTRRERMMDYCFRNDTSHNIMTSWLVAAANAALRAIAGDRT